MDESTCSRSVDTRVAAALSPRQHQCLHRYWVDQATSKEIAADLGVSRHTVDGYFKEAVQALGARDRREAARMAFGTPPANSGYERSGVGERADWRSLLPLRRTGAHNDLPLSVRLFWIVALAVLFAVGFGAFASGVHLVSDLFR